MDICPFDRVKRYTDQAKGGQKTGESAGRKVRVTAWTG